MLNSNVAGIVWKTPVTITTLETIAQIHDIIMTDRCITEYYTATELGISLDYIHAVIHNKLDMPKVSARFVPKVIGPDLKQTRLDMLFLGRSQQFSSDIFLLWMRPGSIISLPPREAKTGMSAGNVMGSSFLDTEGVLLVDYLDKSPTITGACYVDFLRQLWES